MPISDNVPERRNLVVLSTSIIIFYLAGGSITDDTVRLQVINANFSKPEVLAYFIWFLLFWFCYRYWLTQQGSWKEGYLQELSKDGPQVIIYPYLVKKFNLSNDSSNTPPSKHWVYIETQHGSIKFKHTSHTNHGAQTTATLSPDSPKDKLFLSACWIYLFFRKPSLSTYIVPYLIFMGAIATGVVHAL